MITEFRCRSKRFEIKILRNYALGVPVKAAYAGVQRDRPVVATASVEEMSATEMPRVGTHSVIWNLLGPDIVKSSVYTFAMPKVVYLKVSGTQEPIKTFADTIEKRDVTTLGSYLTLVLKKADQEVGEFKADIVEGWWIENA